MKFPLSRYLLNQYSGIDAEATIEWLVEQLWWCDCEVVFYSDATPAEGEIEMRKSVL
jgi:hypothetical protein